MRKLLSCVCVIAMLLSLCSVTFTVNAAVEYVKTGLVAQYDGDHNTASGHDKSATTWADLSGNGNNIASLPKTETCYFSDTAYVLDTIQVDFPDAIDSTIAGNEFTVEMRLGALTSKGANFNTFINCPSDDFSLFRRVDGDFIEFKNTSNARPKVTGGQAYFTDSTVAVTFKVGGKVVMYVDGAKIAEQDAASALPNPAGMFFGHDNASKNFSTEYEAMRFYSRQLSDAEIAQNYSADTATVAPVAPTDAQPGAYIKITTQAEFDGYTFETSNTECAFDTSYGRFTTGTVADPWVSIPLDADCGEYPIMVIRYRASGDIFGNNIYLRDTSVNPGYSGLAGSWTGPAMTGNGEWQSRIIDINETFSAMSGTQLTGIRIPSVGTEGGTLDIEYIAFFKTVAEAEAFDGDFTANAPTGDVAVTVIALVAVIALAGAVICKKVVA